MELIGLRKGQLTPLMYDEIVRKDLKLLEVDPDILHEIESERLGNGLDCWPSNSLL